MIVKTGCGTNGSICGTKYHPNIFIFNISHCVLQVYEAEDGSLQQVHSAVSRSRTLQCSAAGCRARGATVGCCHPDCGHNYHLQVGWR